MIYVRYGKVQAPPVNACDPWFVDVYRWLGSYCGFFPQVWLSRSSSQITGYRALKYFQGKHKPKDDILLGFENIRGFPVKYKPWHIVLNCGAANDGEFSPTQVDAMMQETLDRYVELEWEFGGSISDFPYLEDWIGDHDLQRWLNRWLFVKHDQVVVPSLNLKTAKVVFCRNERQKKKLRRMGFIDDRIRISNRFSD